ncbi:MAG: hypothetical protein K6G27_06565 [Lachnospiraceae bacterium]|nr:hypothetical protein [Lachnospiraceae bacterium]
MNKAIKIPAVTAACALYALLSVKEVKADELLITSYRGLSSPDSVLINNEEIQLSDEPLIQEEVLITDDFSMPGEEILLSDDNGNDAGYQPYYNNDEEILLIEDTGTKDNGSLLVDDSDSIYNRKTDNGTLNVEIKLDTDYGKDRNTVTSGSRTTGKDSTGSDLNNNTSENKKTGATVKDVKKIMLDEINKKRARAGVGLLTLDDALNRVAAKRVNEVTKKYAHTRANGKNWVTILSENGVDYDIAGENLACRINSPEQVVNAWSVSPSHNRCMLNGDYTRAGIGTVTVNGCTYWTLTLTD